MVYTSSKVNNDFGSHSDLPSPPTGGGADLPLPELSFDDFVRAFNESISVELSDLPDVSGSRYVPLDTFFDLLDDAPSLISDADSPSGEKVGHSQYKFQKRLLALLMSSLSGELSSNNLRSYLLDAWDGLCLRVPSTDVYHSLLSDNPSFVSRYFSLWVEAFRVYLDYTSKTWLHIPMKIAYDRVTGYAFSNVHYLANPVTQFHDEYKKKKLLAILKFKFATEFMKKGKFASPLTKVGLSVADELLGQVDPNKFPSLYKALKSKSWDFLLDSPSSRDALWTLVDVMSKPLLFVTVTMGNDDPVVTFIKYRQGWNNFFTQLKGLMKSLGWEHRYYVKGIETTKSGRLHVHLVFLGVTPSHDSQLVDFKKGLEAILRRVGFGYVNDVQIVKSDYNLMVISKSDLKKPEKGFYDAGGNKIRNFTILDTFTLPYGGAGSEGEATFYLLKADPSKKGQNWERVVRYVFKYPLKGETYEDVKNDPDKLESWLKSNTLFWVFGVKRWWISKELTKLLNEAFPTERRFYFFRDEWDFLVWLRDPSNGLYSTIKDLGKFDAFVFTPDMADDVKPLLAHSTLAEFYLKLGLIDILDDFSPLLGKLRAESFITPETLERLIDYDSFKSLISLKWAKLISLTTSQGVGEYG